MGKKAKSKSKDVRAAKKAAVLGNDKKSRLPLILVLCAVVIAGAGVYLMLNSGVGNAVSVESKVSAETVGDQVSYPASLFADGRARFFELKKANLTIRYFILKSSDGIIRAAFDACDVCWPAGKGYYQDGDVMVCRNCGRRFASVLVNEVQGGCNPAPLKRSLQGEQVVILAQDILEGKQYFDFTGKAQS
ncbi:MAG: DUF2318 domain-containing protein [Desulfobacterales bacterium]